MRSHTLDSVSVIVSCFTALYLAPIASWSNSGSSSCQTFNVSTTIEALADLHASMNDVVRVIESKDSPLGDDRMSRRFTWPLRLLGFLRRPSYFETARAALSIASATSLGCET